jgi:carbon monoxide dehydrogenase subunit G
MAKVVVVRVRDYAASAADLWRVFADPEVASSLDSRVQLVGSSGDPGAVGSSYDLVVKAGPLHVEQHVVVTASAEPSLIVAETSTAGRVVAVQRAELAAVDEGARLTWTVEQQAPALLAAWARRRCQRELDRWLAAADAALTSHLPPSGDVRRRPLDEPRRPTADERTLLDALLAHDVPDADELRAQARDLLVASGCTCGCGTLALLPQGGPVAREAESPLPVEGVVNDAAGNAVGGLLCFVSEGRLSALEVYSYGDPLPLPSLEEVTWVDERAD